MFSLNKIASSLILTALAIATICGATAFAESNGEDGSKGVYSSRGGSPWATYYRYLEENPEIYAEADKTFPHGQTGYGEHGETQKHVPGPKIPGKLWPIVTQPYVPEGPEKMMNWAKTMDRITGYSKEPIGSVNLSPAFAALSMGVAGQMLADELQSPQATMPRAREEQNQQIQQSADNTAAMERQQAGCAIDFVASYLYNFTVEDGNKWNKVRNQLFLPMALLLLLPGAILAQVKSIASQGFAVLGEINPFDGLMRSVIAIFLIPGTYLVVNYGIDLANSITKTVADQYRQTFGTNMYEDAMCSHIRAFPFREPIENKNFVPNAEAKMGRLSPNNTPFAELEGKMINIKLTDPCAKLNIVPADRANEQVKYSVNAQRNAYNTANAALAMAWNILCAFQMAYLYYLWFVGPVVAALWVYPMKQLRDAFPSWCEGVLTLCFWSLFWSTVVLLMACFRGVDETGTIIMTALNFLATACVKFAFDFAGLVKDAGREAGRMAERMAQSGAAGGHGAGAKGTQSGAATHGGNPSHTGPGGYNNGVPNAPPAGDGQLASANGGGSDFAFADPGAGDGGAAVPLKGINPGAANISGQVSMHGFPQPPLAGHNHHNALGVVGTALGGAGLFAAAAALAQPHFMHQHPTGIAAPTGDPHGTTGTAGAGAGAFTGDDPSKNIAMEGSAAGIGMALGASVLNEGDLHEGDVYEHNWGDIAADTPGSTLALDPNGPPLNSLPPNPALSLTPPGITLPPASSVDGIPPAAIAAGLPGGAIPGSVPNLIGGTGDHPAGPNLHLNPLHVNGGDMHLAGDHHNHHANQHNQHNQHTAGDHNNHHHALFRDASMIAHNNSNTNTNYTDYAQMANYQQMQQQQWQQTDAQFQQNFQQQQLQQQLAQQDAQLQQLQQQQQQQQQNYADYVLAQQGSNMSNTNVDASSINTSGASVDINNLAATSSSAQYNTYADTGSATYSYDTSSASFAALSDSIIAGADSSDPSSTYQGDSTAYDVDTSYGTTYGTAYAMNSFNQDTAISMPQSNMAYGGDTYAPATPPPDATAMPSALASSQQAPQPYQPQQPSQQANQMSVDIDNTTALPPASLNPPTGTVSVQPANSYATPSASSAADSATPVAGQGDASATFAQAMAVQNAQQQLRNQIATHQDQSKQAHIQQPKQVNAKPPAGAPNSGTPSGGKQSPLGAALGKASTVKGPTPAPKNPNAQTKGMPVVKPAASKGSLQDAVQQGNTRNRYIKSSGLTEEELAELEAKARESGTWMPTE